MRLQSTTHYLSFETNLVLKFLLTQLLILKIKIVITFGSPSCLVQKTAKGPFGLRVKLLPAHLSTTHGGGFTLSL